MALDTSVPHSFVKNGIYYFERRVPCDLQHHYTSRRISFSLRTRSASVAASRAMRSAAKLDEYWYHLRLEQNDLPGKHLIRIAADTRESSPSQQTPPMQTSVTLSEAVSVYLRLKGKDKPTTFHRAAERSCGYVIDACGDRDITGYTKGDANRFRDSLIEKGLAGSSITRIFGTVRSVVNFTASELGMDFNNPFARVYYDRTAGVSDRVPIPTEIIGALQSDCFKIDDELRRMVGLVSDTGLRLAEAAGLLKKDIKLDAPIPHVVIQEHPWRRLKTAGSARLVPLASASLWAAQRAVSDNPDSPFLFPRYNKTGQTKANSASAALNKWLKPKVPEKATMHSFRHSMRDRLRAVECPADIVDQIGGWQTEGVGHSYGTGYPLEVLARWLNAVVKL